MIENRWAKDTPPHAGLVTPLDYPPSGDERGLHMGGWVSAKGALSGMENNVDALLAPPSG